MSVDRGNASERFAFQLATWFGLGRLPKAPGTYGSLGGVLLFWLLWQVAPRGFRVTVSVDDGVFGWDLQFLGVQALACMIVAAVGVWSAGRVGARLGEKDPQIVVIDEVSGLMIAYLGLGTLPPGWLGWKYMLLGLILFRVFDIWKPFPVRRMERLRGGWGIMADDWAAGAYAAMGLVVAGVLGF